MKTIWLRGGFLSVGPLLALLLGGVASASAQEKKSFPTLGAIERADARLDRLVPRYATIERLAEWFDWAEGPVWVREGHYLLFSDVPRKIVFEWKEGEEVSIFLKPSGYTDKRQCGGEPGLNGLTLVPKGRLVLCQHGEQRVAPAASRTAN